VRKRNRRWGRTDRILRASLLSLIQKKGFEALSVQEIIDRAKVGRATFYQHFENKEDLLVSGFLEPRVFLKKHQGRAFLRMSTVEVRVLALSRGMFAFANQYRNIFRATLGKPSGAMIRHLFHRLLEDLIRAELKPLLQRRKANSMPPDAFAQFIGGGLVGLLMWGVDGRTRPSVRNVNEFFRRLAIPVLRAAMR